MEEYSRIMDKLLVKVEELANTQKDLASPMIPREMFKDKKNAYFFIFSTYFPPTLMELCKRVKLKFMM